MKATKTTKSYEKCIRYYIIRRKLLHYQLLHLATLAKVITFSFVEEDIIKRTIINLPNKSSCAYDGLSTKLLKILEPAITKSLTLLINQVLTTGIFPDKLKIAKVIPVYKKGEKTVFSNNRSISLLPAISKILEHFFLTIIILFKRL